MRPVLIDKCRPRKNINEMIDKIKQLRQETSVSLSQCKKALEETGGDLDKSKEILRKWGEKLAGKRGGRETSQGIVEAYIHANKKLGVLVEVKCETDFVAKNEDFKEFAHNLALHIAATNPLYLSEDEIPEALIEKEKEIYKEQMVEEKKKPELMDKIIEGKVAKFKKEIALLSQTYIKDDNQIIEGLLNETIAKIGENITIARFSRLEI